MVRGGLQVALGQVVGLGEHDDDVCHCGREKGGS